MKNNMENNKTKIVNIIFYILSFIIILPIIYYSSKSIPFGDDFYFANNILKKWYNNPPFLAAIKYVWNFYLDAGGYFFSLFMNVYYVPLLRGGIVGVRIFNVSIWIIFFVSLYLLCKNISKYIIKKDITGIIFFILSYLIINGGICNSEIYTWYNVVVAYVLPVAMIFLTISMYIIALYTNKKMCIPTAIFVFLISGTSLNLTAFICGLFLVSIYYEYTFSKRYKISLLCFLSGLFGGIINLASPGNFIRHNEVDNHYYFVRSFFRAFEYTKESVKFKMIHTPFVLLIILIVFVTIKTIDLGECKVKIRHLLLMIFIMILGPVIINYPVFLGHSSYGMPERCVFVQDVAIYLLSFAFAILLGGYLKGIYLKFIVPDYCEKIFCIIFGVLFFNLFSFNIKQNTTVIMFNNIQNGELNEYIQYEEGIIEEITQSEEQELVIVRDNIEREQFVMPIGLSESAEGWPNEGIAEFYNKESIRIEFNE